MNTEDAVQLYMLMFGNIRVGLAIIHLDPEEPGLPPRVVDLNPAAQKISRRLSGEPGERRVDRCFPGLFDATLLQACRRLEQDGEAVDLGDREVGESYFRVQLFSLFDGYYGAIFEESTERRRADAEIKRLLERVRQDADDLERRVAERTAQLEEINRELDSFAYSVSHDLRAPLRALKGYVEILLEERALGEEERGQYLKRILQAVQGMDRLIQDLLAYSRLSRQEILLHQVSLEKVVQDAVQQLELASGGKNYTLEVSGKFPEVVGHHAVLVQVVLNLLTNAIKFVPKGATPRLRIWAEERGEHCRLYVEDNGIGIAPQHLERIFRIFERLHGIEAYPGTGVGLAIVHKAVTRLGGRIGVESREGEGSRFWIELPRSASGES